MIVVSSFFRDWNHAISNKPESYGCTNRMFFPLICALDFTISFKSVASHSDFSGLHVFFVVRSVWFLLSVAIRWLIMKRVSRAGHRSWRLVKLLGSQKVQINHTLPKWGWDFFGYIVGFWWFLWISPWGCSVGWSENTVVWCGLVFQSISYDWTRPDRNPILYQLWFLRVQKLSIRLCLVYDICSA